MIWFDKLLTKSRAFFLGKDKQITQFFTALENVFIDVRDFISDVFLDLWPDTTRQFDEWDNQFNLPPDPSLTEAQRRQRIDGAWKKTGGQSPYYIQTTLRNAGFDVYIYEWWEPGTNPPVPRDPNDYIITSYVPPQCGESIARCGEPDAQCTGTLPPPSSFVFVVEAGNPPAEAGNAPAEAGNFYPNTQGEGYLLVNKINEANTLSLIAQCGEPKMQAGEQTAQCGQPGAPIEFSITPKFYPTPQDPNDWPYILYICGPAWNAPALIEASRRDEFENLLLSIAPAQQWLAILAIYQQTNPTVNIYGS